MSNIVIHRVYDGDQLKLSTVDESEANDFIEMYFDFHGISCKKESFEVIPIDHSKTSKNKSCVNHLG